MSSKIIVLLVMLMFLGCASRKKVVSSAVPVTHEKWEALLQKHVSSDGCVNYKGFIKDSVAFNNYLDLLSSHHPNDTWTINEKYAYWINVYNAFTIDIVIRNYPIASIKEIGGSIYRINTTWAQKFIVIESEIYSLDNIEHDILRSNFKDARVHVAVNCASESCPTLYNHAFEANKIDIQLNKLFKSFLADKSKNIITPDKVKLSKIFSWFKSDFKRNDKTLVEYLNDFLDVQINNEASIEYLDYKWELNECK
jgi:hypothetical protein